MVWMPPPVHPSLLHLGTHQALMDSVYNGCLLREVNYGQVFPQLAQVQGADECAFDMFSSGVSDMLSG